MDTPTIQRTSDYSLFKIVNFNRDKNKNHVAEMKKKLQEENLLHVHPILVNSKMEVVDGQHRLEAAKELGLEVFYIKEDISYQHILDSNMYQRKLDMQDVVKFYALKDKDPSYTELYNISRRIQISVKSVIGLFFGTTSKSITNLIKNGKFQMPTDKERIELLLTCYLDFKAYTTEKHITPIYMFNSSNFTAAFRHLVSFPDFDFKVFRSKLDQKWFELRPQSSIKDWLTLLLSIYNFKNHKPLSIDESDVK